VDWQVFSDRPTLVGHRGMGKGVVRGCAENTVESFLAALQYGIGWVEVDVTRTRDDDLLVAHDPTIADATYLADVTSAQATRQGAVRLEDLLQALPAESGVVFDVKSAMQDAVRPASSTTATLLARICERALGSRRAVALSFDPAALLHMRDCLPSMPLGLLTWFRFPIGHAVAAAAHLDVQVLAVHAGSLRRSPATGHVRVPPVEEIVGEVHAVERQLLVWCPTVRQTRKLVAAGVDALVVDDVPRQARMLAQVG
jgi:glycerophosphoryl diester phosphodiesterase